MDGISTSSTGVTGFGTNSVGVFGASGTGPGVLGQTNSDSPAVQGQSFGNGYAGYFVGNLNVTGQITAGTKDFLIDHPLDPANSYLYHASVESSEMMNVYAGNVILDASGQGVVELPGWFESLNRDFRYQLTAIARPHPASTSPKKSRTIASGSPAGPRA